jgi:hypothetical protein
VSSELTNSVWLRIKALFRRRQLDRDLNDELQFHLAMREQNLIEQGMPANEARYAARPQQRAARDLSVANRHENGVDQRHRDDGGGRALEARRPGDGR